MKGNFFLSFYARDFYFNCNEFCEKSICHFLTNRNCPFFLLANKKARRVMNLVASD